MIKIITITAVNDDERRVALHYHYSLSKSGSGRGLIHPGQLQRVKFSGRDGNPSTKAKKKIIIKTG